MLLDSSIIGIKGSSVMSLICNNSIRVILVMSLILMLMEIVSSIFIALIKISHRYLDNVDTFLPIGPIFPCWQKPKPRILYIHFCFIRAFRIWNPCIPNNALFVFRVDSLWSLKRNWIIGSSTSSRYLVLKKIKRSSFRLMYYVL